MRTLLDLARLNEYADRVRGEATFHHRLEVPPSAPEPSVFIVWAERAAEMDSSGDDAVAGRQLGRVDCRAFLMAAWVQECSGVWGVGANHCSVMPTHLDCRVR